MLSHESKTTAKQGQYDWMAEKKLDGHGDEQPVQAFFCDLVVLESIYIRTAANRPNVFYPCCYIALVFQLVCCRTTANQL